MYLLDAFDRIVASLHRATLDDAHWPAVTALIGDACGAVSTGLAVGEGFGDAARVHFAGIYRRGERRPDLEREYFQVYRPHDERLPRVRQLADSRLVHVPDLYTPQEQKTSFVFNEGLGRLGGRNGLTVRFAGPDGTHIVWSLGDPVGTGGWQSAELELIESLLPHIRHFVLVRQALAAADARSASLTGLLDNTRIGVLHLDRAGRVQAANAPALDILRRGDALSDKGGTLGAWLPADHERLQKLLGRALPALWGEPPVAGSMTLQRPSGARRLSLHVSPVGDAQADFGARRVAALALVVDPTSRPRIDPIRLAAALGLTPAEGRVAALLAEGRSVREAAAEAGYRETYVRWLIQQLYKKQGVSGQVALVRRVLAVDALPRR